MINSSIRGHKRRDINTRRFSDDRGPIGVVASGRNQINVYDRDHIRRDMAATPDGYRDLWMDVHGFEALTMDSLQLDSVTNFNETLP